MRANFRRLIQVCAFLATRKEDIWEYLLFHRVPKLGAFWQGVTWTTGGGEALDQAANREFFWKQASARSSLIQ